SKNLPDVADPSGERDAPLAQHDFQRFPFDKFHQENELVVLMNRVMKSRDVRMTQARQSPHLAFESFDLNVGRLLTRKNLHRLDSICEAMFHFVNVAQAAGAEYGKDRIITEILSCLEAHNVGHRALFVDDRNTLSIIIVEYCSP